MIEVILAVRESPPFHERGENNNEGTIHRPRGMS